MEARTQWSAGRPRPAPIRIAAATWTGKDARRSTKKRFSQRLQRPRILSNTAAGVVSGHRFSDTKFFRIRRPSRGLDTGIEFFRSLFSDYQWMVRPSKCRLRRSRRSIENASDRLAKPFHRVNANHDENHHDNDLCDCEWRFRTFRRKNMERGTFSKSCTTRTNTLK
jgi:hypothetical protein